MLNVSLGDQAVMVQHACGCPLQTLGWDTHLYTIRSYEKLTGGGMTSLIPMSSGCSMKCSQRALAVSPQITNC